MANGISVSNGMANGEDEDDAMWSQIRREATHDASEEPLLSEHLHSFILSHTSLEQALASLLATKLASFTLGYNSLYTIFFDALTSNLEVNNAVRADIKAVKDRDPACLSYCHCILNYKGFQACQAYRIFHHLWGKGQRLLACTLQSRVSEVYAVDIHPAARIGKGVLFDHATGVVIGETAVVGDNVAILHGVTLGGTGKTGGDRHPKIGDGVLIGAGASVIGNIKVGAGAKIGAGAVVLMEVPPRTTAVGCPARLVGSKTNPSKLKEVPSDTMDHVSYVLEWSDYVI